MTRTMKQLAAVSAVATTLLTLAASATPSLAALPQTTRSSFQESYLDTDTCPGMTLDTRLQGDVVAQLLSDTRVQVHQRLTFTVTANDKTFTDNESFTNFTDLASGVQKFAGAAVSIQVPHYGTVLADTGVVIFDPSTNPWTILHVGGHHPLFYDGYSALCAYLAS